MICNPSNAPFRAVIDKPDADVCKNSADYTTNTCRNIVTLNDILNGTGAEAKDCKVGDENCNSRAMRQKCLLDAIGTDGTSSDKNVLQTWKKTD